MSIKSAYFISRWVWYDGFSYQSQVGTGNFSSDNLDSFQYRFHHNYVVR